MSYTAFEDLFLPKTMAGSVAKFAEDVEGNVVAPVFESSARRLAPLGDSVNWDEVRYSRDMAATVGADSPSPNVKKVKRTPRSAVMVDIKEHIDLPARFLYLINTPGMDTADAAATLAIELRNLGSRVGRAREYMAQKTLEGALDFSAMPNSAFSHTLTFPVDALSASNSWATAGTKIRSAELPRLRSTFRKICGRNIGRLICPQSIEAYLVANTEVQLFSKEVLSMQILQTSDIEAGALWAGLGRMSWQFHDNHYATDAAPDTTVDMAAADKIIVLPATGLDSVLGFAEGKVHTPAGPAFAQGTQGTSLLTESRGFWAYAEVIANPIGIRVHAGWKGLYLAMETDGTQVFDATP